MSEPAKCPECGRVHVMGCASCGADLDVRGHFDDCSVKRRLTWELLSTFWAGRFYNEYGQLSNGHQTRHRPGQRSYLAGLRELAERGLAEFDEDTRHWQWTKDGSTWCQKFLENV